MLKQYTLTIKTHGRGFINITDHVFALVKKSAIDNGLCHLFLQHTSASLILCENADPLVQQDLEKFMQRLAPDGDSHNQHNAEGPDDMPAHIRTLLTQSSLTIPIANLQLALGTWQGIYLWEHRLSSHERKLMVTLQA
jgi:secondary thiamine-phosphate synthase enzyme